MAGVRVVVVPRMPTWLWISGRNRESGRTTPGVQDCSRVLTGDHIAPADTNKQDKPQQIGRPTEAPGSDGLISAALSGLFRRDRYSQVEDAALHGGG